MKRKPLPEAGTPRRRWNDLSTEEAFALILPSSPGPGQPFASWAAMLGVYASVRDELLTSEAEDLGFGHQPPFAEAVWRFHRRHGAAALARASYDEIRHGMSRCDAPL